MKITLRIVIALALILTDCLAITASPLQPGDIAIVSVSSIAPKSFEFVCLVPIKSGTTVQFTDDAWLDSVQAFRGSEGSLTYTFPADVAAGHVVRWEKDAPGYIAKGSFTLSASGDNILCYQVADAVTFIYGVGWAKSTKSNWEYLSSSSGATSTSDIPHSLSIANNTIAYLGNTDSYAYNAESTRSGTKEELLKAIATPENYTSSNEMSLAISNLAFTINGTKEVPDSEIPVDVVDTPETLPTDVMITHETAPKISACHLYSSPYADSTLFADAKLSQPFSTTGWQGEDTLLFVADTVAFVLVKDTVQLATVINDNAIETSDGTVAVWFKDDQPIATAESITMESVGRYYAYAETDAGCGLKSDTFVVIKTSVDAVNRDDPDEMLYIDYLGRTYLSKPSLPHICKPIN